MSMSKRNALATAEENQKLDEKGTSQLGKTMDDLPPEVVTIILEQLTLDEPRNNMLGYRLVSHQWKEIVDSLISKRIVSGDLEPFPEMKIFGAGSLYDYSQLLVWINTNSGVFRENSTPFNSLLLRGKSNANDFHNTPHPRIPKTLPVFLSTFEGNLTIFALHDLIIPITNLAAILRSVPTLKMLKLMNVKQPNSLIEAGAPALAPAPPLPNLTTLEVSSSSFLVGRVNTLYEWLLASCADQLASLSWETDLCPPLQKGHAYTHHLRNGNQFAITTTSDSAFRKLKELKISYPSLEFLQLSEIPALQQLSVTGLDEYQVGLGDLVHFAVKCGATLEKLILSMGVSQHLPTEGVAIPKLKTLAIHYPSDNFEERALGEELLVMFPSLKTLHLLYCRPQVLDREIPIAIEETDEVENEMKRAEEDIKFLKKRCAKLTEQMRDIERKAADAWLKASFQAGAVLRGERDVDEVAQRDLEEVADDLDRDSVIARIGRDLVLEQLTVLERKRNKVNVKRLLKRRGIWNTCPNLQIVTASLNGKPEGDICVIRRMDAA